MQIQSGRTVPLNVVVISPTSCKTGGYSFQAKQLHPISARSPLCRLSNVNDFERKQLQSWPFFNIKGKWNFKRSKLREFKNLKDQSQATSAYFNNKKRLKQSKLPFIRKITAKHTLPRSRCRRQVEVQLRPLYCGVDNSRSRTGLYSVDPSKCSKGLCSEDKSKISTGFCFQTSPGEAKALSPLPPTQRWNRREGGRVRSDLGQAIQLE